MLRPALRPILPRATCLKVSAPPIRFSPPRVPPAPRFQALTVTRRCYASYPGPNHTGRNITVFAVVAGLLGGGVYYGIQSDMLELRLAPLGHGSRPIGESILEQGRFEPHMHAADDVPETSTDAAAAAAPQSVQAKAAEAADSSQGAFNEETGEIDWDCPCLGGMAQGPCGEQFKAAFSCFVFSEEEPKGMDCVEKFQAMQDCFRAHPDIYGEELDDEEDGPAERAISESAPSDNDSPAHPIPGNPVGDTRTPAQREKGLDTPSGNPPENSLVLGVSPERTMSKAPAKLAPSWNRGDLSKESGKLTKEEEESLLD